MQLQADPSRLGPSGSVVDWSSELLDAGATFEVTLTTYVHEAITFQVFNESGVLVQEQLQSLIPQIVAQTLSDPVLTDEGLEFTTVTSASNGDPEAYKDEWAAALEATHPDGYTVTHLPEASPTRPMIRSSRS